MRVFLTGATGYIGSAVAEALRAAGHEVMGLARSDAAARRLASVGVQAVRGNLTDPAGVASAARSADGVIHTASTNDAQAGAVDAALADALLAALRGSGKPFLYTSGIWGYGDTGGRVLDETSPRTPAPLVAWRAAVERRVIEAGHDSIRTVVIQPAIVYGRGGGIPAMLVRSAREEGAARYVGSGENRWPTVHVDDLADLYVRALTGAPPGTMLLAANQAHPVKEIARAASEGAGAGGRTVSWPLDQARQELGPFADALVLDQQVSAKRAEALLGWRPGRPEVLDDLRHGSYVR